MKSLNKHTILGAKDHVVKSVEVPEWETTVYVRTFTILSSMDFEAHKGKVSESEVPALYLIFTLCDDKGKLLFTVDDLPELCERNPAVLVRLFYEALRLNKMDVESSQERENFS